MPGILQRLDDHDVAAGRRPCEARDDADLRHLLRFLDRIARNAEHLLDLVHVDDPRAFFTLGLRRARLRMIAARLRSKLRSPASRE